MGAPPQAPAEVKLVAADPGLHDHFGRSLEVFGDTLVTGSRFDEHGGVALAGSAYVFDRDGADWIQAGKLVASDAEFQDLLGHAVAIWGDTVLVSARNDDHSGQIDAGSVYVFVRSGGTWVEEAKLVASDAAAGDLFGISVAIEGDTAVVGARDDDHSGAIDAGSVYVFERNGTTWSEQAKLTAVDAANGDNFGWHVALSASTLLVGSRFDDVAGKPDAGSAYVFVRSGATWSAQAKLTASDGAAGDQLGKYVALDGDTAAVSAPLDATAAGAKAGSVRVFVRSGTDWTEEATLTPQDAAAGDEFGHSVDVVGDRIAAGASQDDHGGLTDAGSGYVFERDGGAWTERDKFVASDATAAENMGSTIVLSGNTVLVGTPHDNLDGVIHTGALYLYPIEPDCNGNGVADADELATGAASDCNGNGLLDACELASGELLDLDGEGTPDVCQPFFADVGTLSIAGGGGLEFTLAAGPSQAGRLYWVLGSASGTAPGTPAGGFVLPLNVDAYLLLTLTGGGLLQGSFGLLDDQGAAATSFTVAAGQLSASLAGTVLHHAYAALDASSGAVTFTSNAIPTLLAP